MNEPVVLLVDDEPGVLNVLGRFAERAGFQVVACSGGGDAIKYVATHHVDIAMIDLRMPDVGGLEVLRAIREADTRCQAVLMTGFATVDTAVEAIKLGAMDYLNKPLDFARVQQLLATVHEETERRKRLMVLEADMARRLEFCGMVGRSPLMQELFGLVRRLAPHVHLALVTGETGTGKELVARALHALGPRHNRRFVTINCSAVVETLFESELFGHVQGAFSGANEAKPGLFELADGGTIFLDEVAELPLGVQAKLLRVLESGEMNRVGSLASHHVDVAVIAATNRDLRAEMSAGRFRADLYYRLNVVELRVPPLGERREDIPYLTAAFIREGAERLGKTLVGVSPAAERILVTAPWRGNVRELRNVIERACILTDTEFVTEKEVTVAIPPESHAPSAARREAAAPMSDRLTQTEVERLTTIEREHIQRALERTGGNKKAAAQMLGLSRRALYRRLERLDLDGHIARRRPLDAATY